MIDWLGLAEEMLKPTKLSRSDRGGRREEGERERERRTTCTLLTRGSQSSQNLVAISQRYCRPVLTLKADYIGNNGKYWLLSPGTSSQSEGYSI